MSSLLQFSGEISRKGVRLEVYLTKPGFYVEPAELIPCSLCNTTHPRLFTFYRKPAGQWGHWVVFRYNNAKHVPDLSCPIGLSKLPRDAKPVTDLENAQMWHRN
jgi:hypothetical protein